MIWKFKKQKYKNKEKVQSRDMCVLVHSHRVKVKIQDSEALEAVVRKRKGSLKMLSTPSTNTCFLNLIDSHLMCHLNIYIKILQITSGETR